MQTPKTIEEYQAQINAIRLESVKRRSAAWAMVSESVLGMEVNPITPAIFSLLEGTGNAYFSRRIPQENDLRNFVWFCSPRFDPDHPRISLRWKAWEMARLTIALKRGKEPDKAKRVISNFYKASYQITEIIRSTFADGAAPVETEEPSIPIAASVEAQLIDTFAREYSMWPLPKPLRHTPIKQLYQLARCIDRRYLGSKAEYYDPQESACTRHFLTEINTRN